MPGISSFIGILDNISQQSANLQRDLENRQRQASLETLRRDGQEISRLMREQFSRSRYIEELESVELNNIFKEITGNDLISDENTVNTNKLIDFIEEL